MKKEMLALLLENLNRHIPVVLTTVVESSGSAPGRAGAKMLVFADGKTHGTVGGGCLEGAVIEEARQALKRGQPRLGHYNLTEKEASGLGMACGGKVTVFIEPLLPGPRLLIAGGGHIAQSLCPLAKNLGFEVSVVDDREEFANRDKFPQADELLVGDIAEILSKQDIHRQVYVVIVTRGHHFDEAALEAVLPSAAAYIGMIGSRRKVEAIYAKLVQKGVERSQLERVCAPIGLDIGGDTPEEIALSILAQIQQVRYNKQ